MARPRLLDLFCGAGGAAMGYHRAGFEIVGVDIEPQPHYPFELHRGDALTWPADGYDAIHASPPCQDHMRTPHRTHGTGWMLDATRQLLEQTNVPWVIENVNGAVLRGDYVVCGCQVGHPRLRRVRYFEVSWGPRAGIFELPCHNHGESAVTVVGHGTPSWTRAKLGRNPSISEYREAMGIGWMNRDELSQAIPPAYTEFVGAQLMAHLGVRT
jgi:DNA (cytosine-5)-methyltransferase 1